MPGYSRNDPCRLLIYDARPSRTQQGCPLPNPATVSPLSGSDNTVLVSGVSEAQRERDRTLQAHTRTLHFNFALFLPPPPTLHFSFGSDDPKYTDVSFLPVYGVLPLALARGSNVRAANQAAYDEPHTTTRAYAVEGESPKLS